MLSVYIYKKNPSPLHNEGQDWSLYYCDMLIYILPIEQQASQLHMQLPPNEPMPLYNRIYNTLQIRVFSVVWTQWINGKQAL